MAWCCKIDMEAWCISIERELHLILIFLGFLRWVIPSNVWLKVRPSTLSYRPRPPPLQAHGNQISAICICPPIGTPTLPLTTLPSKFQTLLCTGVEDTFAMPMYRYVKKSGRIGCVIPRCKLQRGITQPILRLFWHNCTALFWQAPPEFVESKTTCCIPIGLLNDEEAVHFCYI